MANTKHDLAPPPAAPAPTDPTAPWTASVPINPFSIACMVILMNAENATIMFS
jgi:hypothetical protein